MRIALLCATALLLASRANGQKQLSFSVKTMSLTVSRPAVMRDKQLKSTRNDFGTYVSFLVDWPSKRILEVDLFASRNKLEFKDDLGTNLATEKKPPPGQVASPPGPSLWAQIGDNRQEVLVTVSGNSLPTRGAKSVRLKGRLVVVCGDKTRTIEKNGLILDEELAVKIGPFALSFRKAPDRFGPQTDPTLFVLWKGEKRIHSVEAVTSDGAKHLLKGGGRLVVGGGNARTETHEYRANLKGPCTVRITYYDELMREAIPFDLNIGPGL